MRGSWSLLVMVAVAVVVSEGRRTRMGGETRHRHSGGSEYNTGRGVGNARPQDAQGGSLDTHDGNRPRRRQGEETGVDRTRRGQQEVPDHGAFGNNNDRFDRRSRHRRRRRTSTTSKPTPVLPLLPA